MTEHERIAWLLARDSNSPHLELGNGDDAAVVKAPSGAVVSVDAQVEGRHFRREFADWKTLGRRATVAALSDLAAMGASPRAVFSSLILPKDFKETDFRSLSEGIAAAADEVGASLGGGNLSAGPCVIIDTTVVGEAPKGAITRAGAAPGDWVYVRGELGAAALGLEALLAGRDDACFTPYIQAWRSPVLDFAFAESLAGSASAAIDISDGLLQDLSHLCRASGVSAVLEGDPLSASPAFRAAAARLERDAPELVLRGGEAYCLLFTSAEDLDGAKRVGRVVPKADAPILDEKGEAFDTRGFDHFR